MVKTPLKKTVAVTVKCVLVNQYVLSVKKAFLYILQSLKLSVINVPVVLQILYVLQMVLLIVVKRGMDKPRIILKTLLSVYHVPINSVLSVIMTTPSVTNVSKQMVKIIQ